jgi:hypothetical protein
MSANSNAYNSATSTAGSVNSDNTSGAATSFMSSTSSTPNPAIAMLFFFIVTAIYCIINIFIGGGNTMQKIIMKACYIIIVVIGEYFINLNLSYQMCKVYQWQTILFITIIPWLLIFGVMHLFLTMFPGWLSPFSNTFGYLVVKLMGLPDLMKEIKPENSSDAQAFQAIDSLMRDPSLLINQYSPESIKTINDPSDPLGIKMIEVRPIFYGVWDGLKKSGVISKFDGDSKKSDKYREKLYKFVDMKYTISELIWNLLAGGLVTSVSYNYIIGIGCAKTAEQMKERHDAYQATQKKKIANKSIKQANEPNYR